MNDSPSISICIPAYKHVDFLERLLDSVASQTFRDFEVVITDDSPDESVHHLLKKFKGKMEIHYYKNETALGTPENWNEAIRKARGTWIKLMHNDDWFAREDALEIFYKNVQSHPGEVSFFSAFQNIEEETGKKEVVKLSIADKKFFFSNPYHLLKKVYVGNPSCTLFRRDLNIWYDRRYKYIVDFDYYIRVIQETKMPVYIDEILLNIGFHSGQVTGYTKYNPAVQLPENLTFLNEQKKDILKNIVVFDYYWRLLRNMKIDSVEKLKSFSGDIPLSRKILFIVRFQKNIPSSFLNTGIISKSLMSICYFICTIFK